MLSKTRSITTHKYFSIIAANLVILIGSIALLGWFFDIAPLKSVSTGLATMKANTALAFILAGLALTVLVKEPMSQSRGRVALVSTSLIAVLSLLTLCEYILNWNLGIDQLLFYDLDTAPAGYPGRMSLATAICFVLFSTALLLLIKQRFLLAHCLASTVGFISLLDLIGHLYDVQSLYRVFLYSSMAIHTALAFLLLSFSLLFASPNRGMMAIITSDTVGGVMVRGLLPAAIIIPTTLGWLILAGQEIGNYDLNFGSSLFAISTIVILCSLIFWNARSLYLVDIKRKQTGNALRKAEEKYRSIFENAMEGIYQSLPSEQLITANPVLARMLGYESTSELIGKIITVGRQLFADPKRHAEFMQRLEARGFVQEFEAELLCRDGGKIWGLINTREVRDTNRRLLYYEGTITNISARKSLEEQLRQSQKMEAIGSLAGGIAHDFNNLLTVIIGYSELVRDGLDQDHPMHAYIEDVCRAGDRAAVLTNQLLAFSRKQVLQPEILETNIVIEDVQKMLLRLIGEHIELTAKLDPDLGHIKADRGQIEQLLMNLAVNARDAMPRGGKLTIETSNVMLDQVYTSQHVEIQPGQYVMIAVSDTGIGMDKETRSRIFEPFFTTKGKGKGTGLGLSTVYGIVKQSKGSIWVYSEPGQGTTFKIYLPRTDQAAKSSKPRPHPVEFTQGWETILLVEDEETIREFATHVLQANGYAILAAGNANEALQISSQHRGDIHLMISDVIMPGMNGRELAKRIIALRPQLKLLYISGYTDNTIVHHGVLDSGTHFIPKPFAGQDLLRKVREVLSSANGQVVQ